MATERYIEIDILGASKDSHNHIINSSPFTVTYFTVKKIETDRYHFQVHENNTITRVHIVFITTILSTDQ